MSGTERWSISELWDDLACDDHLGSPHVEWLEASYRNPDEFFGRLFTAHVQRLRTPPKSRPGEAYDLYHDAVLCHLSSDSPALRWHDPGAGWRELSYRELHEQTSRRLAAWLAAGAEPGQTICMLGPFGPEVVVDLMTALRLGAIVSLLPTQGRRFLTLRLGNLAPDFLACDPAVGQFMPEYADRILPRSVDGAPNESRSAVYLSGEPIARLFSPLRDPCDVPTELLADDAYLFALRDGLLTFGLGSGLSLCYPGAHSLQSQPALVLAALLVGATYVHLEIDDLRRDPTPLQAAPLGALGVSLALREVLDQAPIDLGPKRCRFWFRSAAEAGDLLGWQSTAEDCGLADTPSANVLVEAANGGALLTSMRRTRFMTLMVRPAAGQAWSLVNVTGEGAPAYGPFGLFVRDGDEGLPWGGLILSAWKHDWTYIGPREPRRRGHVYPKDEVLACLEGQPYVEGASVVTLMTGDASAPHRFGVCVFTGPELRDRQQAEEDTWAREIRSRVAGDLGEEFVPEVVEFFPLCARRTAEGAVDHQWTQSQFISGALRRKAARESQILLARLKRAVTAASN